MSAEANKTIVREWVLAMWGGDRIGELSTPDYVYETPQDGEVSGPALRNLVAQIRSGFPDGRTSIKEQIAEGDTVVTRGLFHGTHAGTFGGIAPTGKFVTVPWIVISHLRGGRIVREFEIYDALGLMQQIGAMPAAAAGTR